MRRLARGDQLVLATHNHGKLREIKELLNEAGIEVIGAADLCLAEPAEDAPDFSGNARIKALAAARASGLPALADDSGFQLAALGGAPGVFSARWAGPGNDFLAAFSRIETLLADRPDRRASFCCALCMAWPDDGIVLFQGRVEGMFIFPPRGEGGFGYDSVFVPDGETRTYAEMTSAEKHRTSHRARALQAWREAVLPQP